MDRKLKNKIAKAFDAPAPVGKGRFIRSQPRARISTCAFMLTQIRFVKKSVWLLSALILWPAVWGARSVDGDTMRRLSAFAPFLALLLITESAKSAAHGMTELESAARFSLRSVVLARMSILGAFDASLFFAVLLICRMYGSVSLLQTGLCLFVPYLLTANVSLHLVRLLRGKEALYGCLAAAILVSGANDFLRCTTAFLFGPNHLMWWKLFALALLALTGRELYKTFKQPEGATWSFALTD